MELEFGKKIKMILSVLSIKENINMIEDVEKDNSFGKMVTTMMENLLTTINMVSEK